MLTVNEDRGGTVVPKKKSKKQVTAISVIISIGLIHRPIRTPSLLLISCYELLSPFGSQGNDWLPVNSRVGGVDCDPKQRDRKARSRGAAVTRRG